MTMETASRLALDAAPPARGLLSWARRRRAWFAALVLILFPLVAPFKALAAMILVYGLYALGFNILFGYLGLLSFGHSALFGAGAYFCGIAIVHFGLPWWVAIAAGIVGRGHRRARHPHARHLFRDGDAGAVAMRLLFVL
jgi:branched-chain amino acid transport system permease protein